MRQGTVYGYTSRLSAKAVHPALYEKDSIINILTEASQNIVPTHRHTHTHTHTHKVGLFL